MTMFNKENYTITVTNEEISFALNIPVGPIIYKCYTSDVIAFLKNEGHTDIGNCIKTDTISNDPFYPELKKSGLWIFQRMKPFDLNKFKETFFSNASQKNKVVNSVVSILETANTPPVLEEIEKSKRTKRKKQ